MKRNIYNLLLPLVILFAMNIYTPSNANSKLILKDKLYIAPKLSIVSRNPSDNNNNGIRDDIDSFIAEQPGAYKRIVLSHYAYFANQFMNTSHSDRWALLRNMSEMMEAMSCQDINPEISAILGRQLDTTLSLRKFLKAEDAYGKTSWAHYVFNDNCRIPTNSLMTLGQSSIQIALDEDIIDYANTLENNPENFISDESSLYSISDLEQRFETQARSDRFRYIVYINGMFTRMHDAASNSEVIEQKFKTAGHSNIRVSTSYNNNEELTIQLIEVAMQHLTQNIPLEENRRARAFELLRNGEFESNALQRAVARKIMEKVNSGEFEDLFDYNYTENLILSHATYGNVIVLGHSQGNLIANKVYERFEARTQRPENFLRMVSLGSPAHYVSKDGPWFNNKLDLVLSAINNVSPIKTLPGNFTISGYDQLNHGLVSTYLNDSIVSNVLNAVQGEFNKMKELDIDSCIDFSANGGGAKTLYYDPIKQHDGLMSVKLESYSAQNSIRVLNKNGALLYSLGMGSGLRTSQFYYKHSKDGVLTITLGAARAFGDAWRVEMMCVE